MTKSEKVLKNIVLVIFGSIIAMLTVLSIIMTAVVDTDEGTTFFADNLLVNVLAIAIFIALGIAVKKNADKLKFFKFIYSKYFIIGLTLVSAGCMVLWIFATQLRPMLDQKSVTDIAVNMLHGDFSDWDFGKYMYNYPFQNGIVLFYYYISMLIGEGNYVGLQLINVIFFVLGMVALYRIVRNVCDSEKVGKWAYIVLPFWVPFSMYTTFIYGTVIGFSLAMLAIMFAYDYIKKRKACYAVLAAVLMGLSCVIKSNYNIFLVALLILIAADWLHTRKNADWLVMAGILAAFIIFGKTANLVTERITGVDTPEGIPKSAWVTMGICNDELFGWWDGYNLWVYYKNDADYNAARRESVDKIKVRVNTYARQPLYAGKFYFKKITSIWANPTFQGITIQNARTTDIQMHPFVQSVLDDNGRAGIILKEILDVMQTLIYAGILMWVIGARKEINLYQLILPITFIGGFLFYIAWEAKCQYTVCYFYILIPYAVMGWNYCFNAVIKRLQKKGLYEKA